MEATRVRGAGRVPELDGLRALAALAVIVFHLKLSAPWPASYVLGVGWTAVDLFFVLSGYLITGILLDGSGDRHFLLSFYARRALRIWPLYFLMVFSLFAASRAPGLVGVLPRFRAPSLAHYATFTQLVPTYWGGNGWEYPPLYHFWSLAVEEQFYLLWPALLFLAGRGRVIPLALEFLAVALIARHALRLNEQLLLTRCDALALGAILAALVRRAATPERRAALGRRFAAVLAVALVVFAAAPADPSMRWMDAKYVLLVFNAAYFGAVGLVACRAGVGWLAPLRLRWLCYLGTISYGIYVYHFPVYYIIDGLWGDGARSAAGVALKLGATLGLAVASWELMERPILSLKDRFPYRRGGPDVAAADDRGDRPEGVGRTWGATRSRTEHPAGHDHPGPP